MDTYFIHTYLQVSCVADFIITNETGNFSLTCRRFLFNINFSKFQSRYLNGIYS